MPPPSPPTFTHRRDWKFLGKEGESKSKRNVRNLGGISRGVEGLRKGLRGIVDAVVLQTVNMSGVDLG